MTKEVTLEAMVRRVSREADKMFADGWRADASMRG